MIKTPLVTVIIPFYNRINFTVRSIYSVLKQTYKNIEIILIDDYSSEDLTEIHQIVQNNKNIYYHKNINNCGPAYSRNIGIKFAKGEYICFLDSDDTFNTDKVKKQLDFMIKKKSNFSFTSYYKYINNKEILIKCNLIPMVYPLIAFYCPIATPTVMIKSDILKNFKFNNQLRFGEDLILWINLSRKYKLHRLNIPLSIINIGTNNHGLNRNVQKSVRIIVGKELYLHNRLLFYIHKLYCMIRLIKL
jgi:glycosyltransferase involved in cell wall biosynthesis